MTPAPIQPTPPDGAWENDWGGQLPDGYADVCGPDGHTLLALTACGPENPTIEQACQTDAYRAVLDGCASIPKPSLPTTGVSAQATTTIGGAGVVLVLLGSVLLRKVARH